jgi:hypothetical protein
MFAAGAALTSSTRSPDSLRIGTPPLLQRRLKACRLRPPACTPDRNPPRFRHPHPSRLKRRRGPRRQPGRSPTPDRQSRRHQRHDRRSSRAPLRHVHSSLALRRRGYLWVPRPPRLRRPPRRFHAPGRPRRHRHSGRQLHRPEDRSPRHLCGHSSPWLRRLRPDRRRHRKLTMTTPSRKTRWSSIPTRQTSTRSSWNRRRIRSGLLRRAASRRSS